MVEAGARWNRGGGAQCDGLVGAVFVVNGKWKKSPRCLDFSHVWTGNPMDRHPKTEKKTKNRNEVALAEPSVSPSNVGHRNSLTQFLFISKLQ